MGGVLDWTVLYRNITVYSTLVREQQPSPTCCGIGIHAYAQVWKNGLLQDTLLMLISLRSFGAMTININTVETQCLCFPSIQLKDENNENAEGSWVPPILFFKMIFKSRTASRHSGMPRMMAPQIRKSDDNTCIAQN